MFMMFALIEYNLPSADSADFPAKPINVYVGMAPGGATDVAVRTIVAEANKHLEHPIVVVNKPGGGGELPLIWWPNPSPMDMRPTGLH